MPRIEELNIRGVAPAGYTESHLGVWEHVASGTAFLGVEAQRRSDGAWTDASVMLDRPMRHKLISWLLRLDSIPPGCLEGHECAACAEAQPLTSAPSFATFINLSDAAFNGENEPLSPPRQTPDPIPRCDICSLTQYMPYCGSPNCTLETHYEWNGETGNHVRCEANR